MVQRLGSTSTPATSLPSSFRYEIIWLEVQNGSFAAMRDGNDNPREDREITMLTKLTVQNFRSIEHCDVELGPITVFFGPTSAGKSTLFYALLVLRNFILNPNQVLDGLFNLGFQNLGGFEQCVFDHKPSKTLGIVAHYGGRCS